MSLKSQNSNFDLDFSYKIKMAEKKLIILIILIWNEGIGEDGMEEDKKLEG